MPRPIQLTVDFSAMVHNCRALRKLAAGRTFWCVVKANAYGHGLKRAVDAFAEADGFASVGPDDALDIRRLGWNKRILLLEGFFDEADIPVLESTGAEPIIGTDRQIEMLERAAPLKDLRVHVKVNTGMNRLGYRPADVKAAAARLSAIPGVTVLGIATHFANAEPTYPQDRVATCASQMKQLEDLMREPWGQCFANTAGILFHPEVKGDAVRAGIGLYGASPDPSVPLSRIGLRVTESLTSKVIAIQQLAPGEGVGYGSRFVAHRPTRIAVVACGYADGYPRTVCPGAQVLVAGRRAPIAGAVAMDMMMVDVTDLPGVAIGDPVELWGEHLPIAEVAGWAGSISYVLMCAVTARVRVVETGRP